MESNYNFEKRDIVSNQKLKVEVLNYSSSNIDFNLNNVILLEDLKILNQFIAGFSASGTETYEPPEYELDEKLSEITKQLEDDHPIIEKFMERYGVEWNRLGED